jgi:hypothetical protein
VAEPGGVDPAGPYAELSLEVPVTASMFRFSRQSVLAFAGVVLASSYLGFLAATSPGHGWSAPAVATEKDRGTRPGGCRRRGVPGARVFSTDRVGR